MRWLLPLALVACGRVGFEDELPGQVVHYPMDDDPGATGMLGARPASFAAPCAPCPAARAGRHGGGYAFPGDLRVTLPGTEPLLTTRGPFTLSVWLDASAEVALVEIPLSKPRSLTSTRNTLNITVLGNGTIQYELVSTIDQPYYFPASTSGIRGGWHHVALTFDGAVRTLHVDGVAYADETAGLDGELPIGLGADLDGGARVFGYAGGLDELRIFDRVLGPDEIAALAE